MLFILTDVNTEHRRFRDERWRRNLPKGDFLGLLALPYQVISVDGLRAVPLIIGTCVAPINRIVVSDNILHVRVLIIGDVLRLNLLLIQVDDLDDAVAGLLDLIRAAHLIRRPHSVRELLLIN